MGWAPWRGRRNRAPGPHAHGNAARQVVGGLRMEVCGQQKQSNDPDNNQHNLHYANNWAPLTRKRHTMPHSAQPRHTNYWAPRTRKRHQQEHRPQRPTKSSDLTQHAKGRTGDCPGPRKEATTRRNVTRGVSTPPPLFQCTPAPRGFSTQAPVGPEPCGPSEASGSTYGPVRAPTPARPVGRPEVGRTEGHGALGTGMSTWGAVDATN